MGAVDDFNGAVEWSIVVRADSGARILRGHVVLGLKHSETGGPDVK